ncbi:PPE family protein [Mycobacterium seoulense]|nr:PPE family protein [Mycobacterium seoulense]
MFDFGAFPPEFNSARIYSGPGSGSLMTAASAWNSVAAESNAAASSYDALITALSSEEWLGPASGAMAAAVQPYLDWLTATAAQAELAATQAQAAAAAYETALASSVPPPVIAANRAQTSQLTVTNVLGQNTPMIAQLEAQYGEYWAQDAGAMYSYAAQSATATKSLSTFQSAPKITNDAGTATQAGTVARTTASTAAGNTANTAQNAATTTATAAPQLAAATTQTDPFSEIWFLLTGQSVLPTNLGALVNGYTPFAGLFYNTEGLPYFSVGMGNFGVQMAKTLGVIGGAAPAAAKALPGSSITPRVCRTSVSVWATSVCRWPRPWE